MPVLDNGDRDGAFHYSLHIFGNGNSVEPDHDAASATPAAADTPRRIF